MNLILNKILHKCISLQKNTQIIINYKLNNLNESKTKPD